MQCRRFARLIHCLQKHAMRSKQQLNIHSSSYHCRGIVFLCKCASQAEASRQVARGARSEPKPTARVWHDNEPVRQDWADQLIARCKQQPLVVVRSRKIAHSLSYCSAGPAKASLLVVAATLIALRSLRLCAKKPCGTHTLQSKPNRYSHHAIKNAARPMGRWPVG